MIQLTLTLKMATAQVFETPVTVNNNPIRDYVHRDNPAQATNEITPWFNLSTINDSVIALIH